MAITIGSGIQIGGGISFDVGTGGGGGGGGGGGPVTITGTFEVGQFFFDANFVGAQYPSPAPGLGYLSDQTPGGILNQIVKLSDNTTIVGFNEGTYGSATVSSGTINGLTNISVTIDGITQTSTLEYNGQTRAVPWPSDVFSLATKVGQTLSFTINIT